MNFDKLFAGWGFRTSTPAYEPGDEVTAFVTGDDGSGLVVRIGDTKIHVEATEGAAVDARVRLRIDRFDAETHEGRGTILEVVEPAG